MSVTGLVDQIARYRSPDGVLDGDGVPQPPTQEEFEQVIVAPGTEALLPAGIVYQAGWEPLGDGIARHARAAARALSGAGLPVSLRSLPITRMQLDGELDPAVIAEVDYLRKTSLDAARIAVRQVVIHNYRFLEAVIAPAGARMSGFQDELRVYRSTIVYTSWERSTVHPEIVEVLNRCGRTWVPCQMNKEVFERAGVKRVDLIPCPFDPNGSQVAAIGAPRGSESVPYGKRFYAIGKWEPRKNYHALLGAFLSEFSVTEHASLIIKTSEWGSWKDYPSVDQSLAWWLTVPEVRDNGWTAENVARKCRVVTKKVSDEKILSLHRDNNIYVTCSHGEAWDLPAFDAHAAGNRLVYTGWGGADDYARKTDVRILGGVVYEPVHSGYGWEADAEWAACPVEAIRSALGDAMPPVRRIQPPLARWSPARVGQAMSESIRALSSAAHDELSWVGGFG
jgi:glycosyltransferase involved in cell wall biosynthesis